MRPGTLSFTYPDFRAVRARTGRVLGVPLQKKYVAVVAVAVGALTGSLLVPAAATGATSGSVGTTVVAAQAKPKPKRFMPKAGATFNVPAPWGGWLAQHTIVRTVEDAMNHTKPRRDDPKPVIALSNFLYDRAITTDTLIRACKRGVGIRVILDWDARNGTQGRLFHALNADNVRDRNHDRKPDRRPKSGPCGTPKRKHHHNNRETVGNDRVLVPGVHVPTRELVQWGKDRSYAIWCKGACRGVKSDFANMHTKMYLLSNSGAARNVVMVSSANMNKGGAVNGWNDLYVMNNRPKLYGGFLKIHRAMTLKIPEGRGREQMTDGPYTARFFPMKLAGAPNDPTLKDLRTVRCTSKLGKTQIYISMFYWKGIRGNHIADKVLDLARHGCNVQVIVGAPSNQIYGRLRDAAAAHLITLYDSRYGERPDPDDPELIVPQVRTHGKYIAIKGTYRNNRKAYVVMTGSANWVGGSLAVGDEVSINIERKRAYDQYVANWNATRAHSVRKPGPDPIDWGGTGRTARAL